MNWLEYKENGKPVLFINTAAIAICTKHPSRDATVITTLDGMDYVINLPLEEVIQEIAPYLTSKIALNSFK